MNRLTIIRLNKHSCFVSKVRRLTRISSFEKAKTKAFPEVNVGKSDHEMCQVHDTKDKMTGPDFVKLEPLTDVVPIGLWLAQNRDLNRKIDNIMTMLTESQMSYKRIVSTDQPTSEVKKEVESLVVTSPIEIVNDAIGQEGKGKIAPPEAQSLKEIVAPLVAENQNIATEAQQVNDTVVGKDEVKSNPEVPATNAVAVDGAAAPECKQELKEKQATPVNMHGEVRLSEVFEKIENIQKSVNDIQSIMFVSACVGGSVVVGVFGGLTIGAVFM